VAAGPVKVPPTGLHRDGLPATPRIVRGRPSQVEGASGVAAALAPRSSTLPASAGS